MRVTAYVYFFLIFKRAKNFCQKYTKEEKAIFISAHFSFEWLLSGCS